MLQQRSKKNQNYHKFKDEDANLYRKDLRDDHVGNLMYSEISEGNVGAVVLVDDEEKYGYYLVEWVGSPFFVEINGNVLWYLLESSKESSKMVHQN